MPKLTPQDLAAQQLYADLSPYYDRFCHSINYAQQCRYAQRVCAGFNPKGGRRYLDLACGTGQHLRLMQDAGYSVAGVDNSQAMLDQAALRCPEAQLSCQDMSTFANDVFYDLITCFLYSLHYAQPLANLQQVLTRSWQALNPGGILLFDMVDKHGIDNQAGLTTYVQEATQHFTFSSRWHYLAATDQLQLALRIARCHQGQQAIWQDCHPMTALAIPEVHQYLLALGFDVWIMEHNYERLEAWQGATFNAVVIAQKPE